MFKNQITSLVIGIDLEKKNWTIVENICNNVLAMMNGLTHLTFYDASYRDIVRLMIDVPSSKFSLSTLLTLKIKAQTFIDCLYILDGISGDIIQQLCIDRLQPTANYSLNLLLYAANDFEEKLIFNSFFKIQFIHRQRPRVFIQKLDVRDVSPRYYSFRVYTIPYNSTTLSSYIFSTDLEKYIENICK